MLSALAKPDNKSEISEFSSSGTLLVFTRKLLPACQYRHAHFTFRALKYLRSLIGLYIGTLIKKIKTYLIFSSIFPLVSTTIPHSSSLNPMPRLVPPQPWYSHSATSQGTPSHSTSWTNVSRLKAVPFAPAHLLNASRIRLNSLSDTANKIPLIIFSHSYNALLSTLHTPYLASQHPRM